MLISVVAIFLALVFQFRNAIKPLIVFAAIPYGVVGALVTPGAAWASPFGFMAFLGVASLIGVIVSHVIVLFDFIEEAHERGEPLREALLDAGIMRLRPVLITVGATVFGLVPLALARRTAVGAALLRADRRADRRHVRHAAARAGALRDLRARPEDREVGRTGAPACRNTRGADGVITVDSGRRAQ